MYREMNPQDLLAVRTVTLTRIVGDLVWYSLVHSDRKTFDFPVSLSEARNRDPLGRCAFYPTDHVCLFEPWIVKHLKHLQELEEEEESGRKKKR